MAIKKYYDSDCNLGVLDRCLAHPPKKRHRIMRWGM